MTASDVTRRLATGLSLVTLAWLVVYVPAETYVTLSIAGLPGLLYSGYIMNVVGMGLMCWGAISARRFRWASQGNALWAGPVELWLAPLFTALAVGLLIASMVLVFRTARGVATSSR